jgi:hypothetical protein
MNKVAGVKAYLRRNQNNRAHAVTRMHRPVMSWGNACGTCMHQPVKTQVDACTYCMGSKASSLSQIYLSPATLPNGYENLLGTEFVRRMKTDIIVNDIY